MRGLKSFIKKRYSKEEFAWIMQDWANSVYSLMITTAIFPLFFKSWKNTKHNHFLNSYSNLLSCC